MRVSMAADVSNNIIRYAGETYPSKSTIKIKGTPMNLEDGWRVEIRYKVPTGTTLPNGHGEATEETELVIDGVLTDPQIGKFNIYPHARLVGDNILTPENYITSEVREKLIDAAGGDDTGIPHINQVWDDDEVAAAGGSLEYPFYSVRVKDFDSPDCAMCYKEEQVHNVGFIQIASRWLK